MLVLDDAQWVDTASIRVLCSRSGGLQAERLLAIFLARDDAAGASPTPFAPGADAWSRSCVSTRYTGATRGRWPGSTGSSCPRGAVGAARADRREPAVRACALRGAPGDRWLEPELALPAPRRLAALVRRRMRTDLGRRPGRAVPLQSPSRRRPAPSSTSRFGGRAGRGDGRLDCCACESRDGATVVAFAHPLYRAAAYGELSATDRRRLHLRAAEPPPTNRPALRHRAERGAGSRPGARRADGRLADE